MKKNIIGLFLLLSIPVFSQDLHFGIKTGINFSTISGDNSENIKGRISYHGGFLFETPINKSLNFSPELLFSSQGAKFKDADSNRYLIARNDYLNLPLLVRYYSLKGFMLEAGPQVGILISAKRGNSTSDISSDYKGQDYGFNLGLGYKTEIGLGFNMRYYIGLANISDFDSTDSSNRNNVFQVSLSYFFN